VMLLLAFLASFSGASAGFWVAAWLDDRRARNEPRKRGPHPCTRPIPRETQEQLIRRGGVIHPQGGQVH